MDGQQLSLLSLPKQRGLPTPLYKFLQNTKKQKRNQKAGLLVDAPKEYRKATQESQNRINTPKTGIIYISLFFFSGLNCLTGEVRPLPTIFFLWRCSMPENGNTTTKTDIWTFIELLRHRISRGYVYYYKFEQRKPQKDAEIERYYKSDIKKYQRTYRKHAHGLRNYFYMRWGSIGIVLASEGKPDPDLRHIEQFLKDVRKEPLHLRISDITELIIHAQPRANKKTLKVNVYLSKETIQIIKANLLQTLKQYANPSGKKTQKQAKNAIRKAWLVNGYPSFNGLLEQKKQLKKWYLREARIRGINIPDKDLKLSYFRKNRLKRK